MKSSHDQVGGDMRTKTAAVAGCLMLVLVSPGCGQGNWQDTGSACTGTDWKTAPADQTAAAAKLYQKICASSKVASDLRCKDKRLEVQCK
jgi:hypothetical protein